MSIITVYETVVSTVDPLYSTVTKYFYTTIAATYGQTITLLLPSVDISSLPTTKYTPTLVESVANPTIAVTEIDLYLQNVAGSIYSTVSITVSPETTSPANLASGEYIIVIEREHHDHGWNSWSDGAQAGLVVGVVLAALILLMLICCRCVRRDRWIVREDSRPWYPWGQVIRQTHSNVPVVTVSGPLDPSLASPYGYGGRNGGYGYNLRGGGEQVKCLKDKIKMRNVRQDKAMMEQQDTPEISASRTTVPAFYKPPTSASPQKS